MLFATKDEVEVYVKGRGASLSMRFEAGKESSGPGWTPIFGLLGGLIMESGGQLSHGALVAREYGLPAVAGIAGITQLLYDGQWCCWTAFRGRSQ